MITPPTSQGIALRSQHLHVRIRLDALWMLELKPRINAKDEYKSRTLNIKFWLYTVSTDPYSLLGGHLLV